MTSRERLLCALKGGTPDTVPTALFIYDQGYFLNDQYPGTDPWDHLDCQKKVIDIQRKFGADVFVRLTFAPEYPHHVVFGGVDITNQTDDWKVQTEEYFRGETRVLKSRITTPEGQLTQEFSYKEFVKGSFGIACTQKPVKCEEDLDLVIKYEPCMREDFPKRLKKHVDELKDYLKEDGIIGGWCPYGPFNTCSLLIEHEELYMLFLTEPEYYHKMMRFCIERAKPYAKAFMDAGVDVMCIGGNVPGGFLGRKTYETHILEYEREYIEFCQSQGQLGMYHNCGEIMNLVEAYKGLNCAVIEPFSPAPLGDANLALAKQQIAGDYAIIGGVDQVNVLQRQTPQEVEAVTRKTVETGKPGGGFVLQTADFMEIGTPEENVKAFIAAGRKYGAY